jgi:hypothetical protein
MQRLLDAMAQMEERLTDVLTGRGREQAIHRCTSSFNDDSGADCNLINVGTDCTAEDDPPTLSPPSPRSIFSLTPTTTASRSSAQAS